MRKYLAKLAQMPSAASQDRVYHPLRDVLCQVMLLLRSAICSVLLTRFRLSAHWRKREGGKDAQSLCRGGITRTDAYPPTSTPILLLRCLADGCNEAVSAHMHVYPLAIQPSDRKSSKQDNYSKRLPQFYRTCPISFPTPFPAPFSTLSFGSYCTPTFFQ